MPTPSWPSSAWPNLWTLAAAQAQHDAIAAALMPTAWSPAGRLQVPSIELQETAQTLVITAFLPGIQPEAVQVRATPTTLTFFGQRSWRDRHPVGYGLGLRQFQQTVNLPVRARDDNVQVAYDQGAVVVTLPKANAPWSQIPDWQHQRQRLAQGWRRAKGWLGRTLRTWGDRLLEER
jgi:HSP20 family molecular chaperone IbpA